MANEPKTFDNMSDEDFLKLNEEDFSGNVPEGETSLTNEEEFHAAPNPPADEDENQAEETPDGEEPDVDDTSADGGEPDGSGDDSVSQSDEEFEASQKADSKTDPMDGKGEPITDEGTETPEGGEPKAEEEGKTPAEEAGDVKPKAGKDETPAKAGYYKLPEGMDTPAVDAAIGFFTEVTKPFKADGKDFTVRSPEDAIRLMQQGVNYSRRMQEIKPMKALNRMLTDQNLNDPAKLNFLIDVSKGDKEAITQLLKSHNIDPMDLDLEKDSGYQARNYQGDPQDNDFRDALDTALTSPEGQALVSHIHKDWDKASKAKLRENPNIIGNLQELKASGIYDKVVEELTYQKSIGYLTNVPFLQAFDQVGEAMKKVGAFDNPPNPAQTANSMAPLQAGQPQSQPVASGARKQQAPKKTVANPHLSSTPPSKQSGNTTPKTPDFDKLSDEEFLKMAPPE